jgi:hypothetical protein
MRPRRIQHKSRRNARAAQRNVGASTVALPWEKPDAGRLRPDAAAAGTATRASTPGHPLANFGSSVAMSAAIATVIVALNLKLLADFVLG